MYILKLKMVLDLPSRVEEVSFIFVLERKVDLLLGDYELLSAELFIINLLMSDSECDRWALAEIKIFPNFINQCKTIQPTKSRSSHLSFTPNSPTLATVTLAITQCLSLTTPMSFCLVDLPSGKLTSRMAWWWLVSRLDTHKYSK